MKKAHDEKRDHAFGDHHGKIRRQKRRRSRRQKQKMLDAKHAHAEIKALRRKVTEAE